MSYRQIAQKQWRPETYRCRVHLPTPGCKGLLETLHLKAVRVTPTLPAWGRHPRGCEAAVHATRSFIAQTQGEKVVSVVTRRPCSVMLPSLGMDYPQLA